MVSVGPKTYSVGEWPEAIVSLVHQIVPWLLAGESAALAILRAQFDVATIAGVESSGVGYFVTFDVPEDVPRAPLERVTGGDAVIELSCTPNGAGCVLFVRGGAIDMLELYTYDGGAWPDDATVLAVSHVRGLLEPPSG